MIAKSRQKLPYRKNCEGYLFYEDDNGVKVLARDTHKGFLVFPGGGIDDGETPDTALRREVMEETGAVLENNLTYLGKLNFDWDETWAKTDKQKARYKIYRGEEMHFFSGKILKFVKPCGDPSDEWTREKLMPIMDAVKIINSGKPFSKDIKKYREMQLKSLKR